MQAPKRTAPIRDALRAKASATEQPAEAALDQHAIEEGRKPLAPRRKDASAIKAKTAELYGAPAAGLNAIAAIEAAFKFSPQESDGELNYLHVEMLLDQAAALLDSCHTLRSRRDALHIEKWKVALELDRFFRLDQILELEREAGLDTLPYERAALAANAEAAFEANQKAAESHLKGLADDLLATGFNKRMAARELAAWISAYPLKDSDLRGDDASYTFDGARKTKPEHLFDAARQEVDEAAWEDAAKLMARRSEITAATESARLRKESWTRQAKWALADIRFRRERSQIERDADWEKAFQAQTPNGLLNYNERIAPIERHFASEFREALARITAARRGLKELYDYAPAFPQEGAPGYFDDVVAWVKQARNRSARIAQTEQRYVLALSVKDLAKGQWDAGRSASEWTFEIPESLFPGQAHVRLRGIGIAVVGTSEDLANPKSKPGSKELPPPKPEGFWTARVSVPPAGSVHLASGATRDIEQKLPACFLGRVEERGRGSEVSGASILHNASPIGKNWRLALSQKSTDGTPTENLQDVQLYLHVAVRSLS